MKPSDISFIAYGHMITYGRLDEGRDWDLGLKINGTEIPFENFIKKNSIDGGSYYGEIRDLFPGLLPESRRIKSKYVVEIPLTEWKDNSWYALDLVDEFFNLNDYTHLLNSKKKE